MILRPLTAADILAVCRIEKEAFSEPGRAWTEGMFLSELSDPSKYYFAGTENGAVMAYGGFAHILDEAHIMNIAVAEAYRGRGFGRQILTALIQKAAELGAAAMTLEVRVNNAPAIRLYESAGFIAAGIRPNYYGTGEHALIYWLRELFGK